VGISPLSEDYLNTTGIISTYRPALEGMAVFRIPNGQGGDVYIVCALYFSLVAFFIGVFGVTVLHAMTFDAYYVV